MSMVKCRKAPATARLMFFWVVIATVLVNGDAILNTGTTGNGNKDFCKITGSDGDLTTTCICTGATVQNVDLAGTHAPHMNTNVVKIANCQSVKITSNVFGRLRHLRQVDLANIRSIDIAENGFNWKLNESLKLDTTLPSGITVKIKDSVVPVIPSFAFTGIIESIYITSTQIETVGPFAFTNLQGMETIEFVNVNFTKMGAQAFKKFSVGTVTLNGGHYGSLPSRTMVDVEVRENLLIENISADLLRSSALIVAGPTSFVLQNCRFGRTESEAFRISVRGPTTIRNNVFESLASGTFSGISVERELYSTDKQQNVKFTKNNITQFEPNALVFNTSRLNPTLDQVIVDQSCDCNTIADWTSQLVIYPPAVWKKLENSEKPMKDSAALWCRSEKSTVSGKPDSYQTFGAYNQKNCGVIKSKLTMILIISACSLLLLIIIIAVTVCLCKRHSANNQTWSNVPTSNNYDVNHGRGSKKSHTQAPDSRITMVVPDGRVYRETELHVIVEQAEPINDEHIYQNVTRLPPKTSKPVPLPRTSLRTDL